jgi:peroxiredoxin Q/BCP
MPLPIGSSAPDFTAPSTGGQFTLSEQMKGKPCILYFYPRDFTPGCTQEACAFRDHFEVFRDLNIEVVGISMDDLETHRSFKEKHRLPFELCSDGRGKIAASYQAKLPFVPMTKRISYLLDRDHKIRGVFANFLNGAAHVQKMSEAVAILD